MAVPRVLASILRIAAAVAVVYLVVMVGGVFLLDPCANQIVFESPSPNRDLRVIVFERDCGATTGFSTQASILPEGAALPNRAGNLFIADTNHGAAPSGPGGGPELRVRWEGPRAVAVNYHPRARVSLAQGKLGDVSVSYAVFQ